MKNLKSIKINLTLSIFLFFSCRPQDYHTWNDFTKYKTEVKTSLNGEFSKKLNCSNKDYHWEIKNLNTLSKVKFIGKIENKKGDYCEEKWKFMAIEKGKDSVILEYRNGVDIIVRNTMSITIE